MKKIFYGLLFIVVSNNVGAQITAIADYRFEQALVDLGIDSDEVVNGQMATTDALSVTTLVLNPIVIPNYPYTAADFYDGLIHDLTGLEAFTNLDSLTVNVTMVENVNLGSLVNLKYLDVVDNMLSSIDVSNNPLLEYLNISSGGDVYPFNTFDEIDLSNNPILHTLIATRINKINLNNNANNDTMLISVGCNCWDFPPEYIDSNVCILVDNALAAQNNQYPYSEWTVSHPNRTVTYTDNMNDCSLNVSDLRVKKKVTMHPNPNDSGTLYFALPEDTVISKVMLFDTLGRTLSEHANIRNQLNVSHLQKGNYILQIFSANGKQTEKLIVR